VRNRHYRKGSRGLIYLAYRSSCYVYMRYLANKWMFSTVCSPVLVIRLWFDLAKMSQSRRPSSWRSYWIYHTMCESLPRRIMYSRCLVYVIDHSCQLWTMSAVCLATLRIGRCL
jgi:hypothetical protein